jgi:hypothetical protein
VGWAAGNGSGVVINTRPWYCAASARRGGLSYRVAGTYGRAAMVPALGDVADTVIRGAAW